MGRGKSGSPTSREAGHRLEYACGSEKGRNKCVIACAEAQSSSELWQLGGGGLCVGGGEQMLPVSS